MFLSPKMSRTTRSLPSLLVVLSLTSVANAGLFLDLDGLQGPATQKGYEKWIEGASMKFDVARSVASGSTKTATGSAQFSALSLTKSVDVSSPELFLLAANGQVMSEAVVELTNPTGDVYLRVVLHDVVVSSYSVSASASEEQASSETIQLTYSRITMEYIVASDDGKGATTVSRTWDIPQNTEL